MQNGETLFGKMNDALGPIAFLLLFTVSAGIVGLLVFGKPAIWFLNGRKSEAVRLALLTVGFLFLETVVLLVVLTLTR